jgi:hypothetical protein
MISSGGKMMRKFRCNRKGTAEVIGSVLFIIIIIFFFSNVYLWHDSATKQMNTALSDKMNSPISVVATAGGLAVTNEGGVDAVISRVWITDGSQHVFADLEHVAPNGAKILVRAGQTKELTLELIPGYSTPNPRWDPDGETAIIQYTIQSSSITCKVLSINGNSASCAYPAVSLGGNGNSAIGPVLIADFQSFVYYTVSQSTFNPSQGSSGYSITSAGENVIFKVTLTNTDPSQSSISLNRNSQLFFTNTGSSDDVTFYAVRVTLTQSTGTIEDTFPGVILPYNMPIPVYFAAKSPVIDSFAPQKLTVPGAYPVNLALIGTIGASPFGQNIPFVSAYVNS